MLDDYYDYAREPAECENCDYEKLFKEIGDVTYVDGDDVDDYMNDDDEDYDDVDEDYDDVDEDVGDDDNDEDEDMYPGEDGDDPNDYEPEQFTVKQHNRTSYLAYDDDDLG